MDNGHFAIDRNKADEDVRFDGVFVLRTNTDLNPLLAMLRYKSSGPSNRPSGTAKHLLTTRPSFTNFTDIRGQNICLTHHILRISSFSASL